MGEVTVLGSCGAWPEAGRATSGFLVSSRGRRIVLDLGYATLPRLLAHCGNGDVDAVVISHEHPDHCVDLNALYRERRYDPSRSRRIPLYCPPGVLDRVGHLESNADLREVFDIHELPGTHQVGPFTLEGIPLPHFVPNAGIRLTGPDGIIAYTGDTGPSPELVDLGYGTDLFIMDATYQGEPPKEEPRYLLTAAEAGEYAAAAKTRALLLTHFWPGSDREKSVAEAAVSYPGKVIAAEENLTIEFGQAQPSAERKSEPGQNVY